MSVSVNYCGKTARWIFAWGEPAAFAWAWATSATVVASMTPSKRMPSKRMPGSDRRPNAVQGCESGSCNFSWLFIVFPFGLFVPLHRPQRHGMPAEPSLHRAYSYRIQQIGKRITCTVGSGVAFVLPIGEIATRRARSWLRAGGCAGSEAARQLELDAVRQGAVGTAPDGMFERGLQVP